MFRRLFGKMRPSLNALEQLKLLHKPQYFSDIHLLCRIFHSFIQSHEMAKFLSLHISPVSDKGLVFLANFMNFSQFNNLSVQIHTAKKNEEWQEQYQRPTPSHSWKHFWHLYFEIFIILMK